MEKFQALENFLTQNNIVIHNLEYITIDGIDFILDDPDDSQLIANLPRTFDDQRLILPEEQNG